MYKSKKNIGKKSISGLIREILVPFMVEHGFESAGSSPGDWLFRKEGRSNGHILCIYVKNFPELKGWRSIRLQINIYPSCFYEMVDANIIMVGTEKLNKCLLGGWLYETMEDVRTILEVIAYSMKEKGFDVLEAMCNDPDDVLPTLEDQKDFYENREKYAEDFLKKYRLECWDVEKTLDAIREEIRDIPPRAVLKYQAEVFRVATAYGEVCVSQNGKWEWYKDSVKVILFGKKGFESQINIYPLDWTWRFVQRGEKDFVRDSIREALTNAGYL